jgi:hypothetical protein
MSSFVAIKETNWCDIVIYSRGVCRNEYGGYRGQVLGITRTEMGKGPQVLPSILNKDNTGAILMAKNTAIRQRTKHVDIRYRIVNDMILAKELWVEHIRSGENPSDAMTKNLPRALFGKNASIMSDRLLGSLYDPQNTEDVKSYCATVDAPSDTVPCGQCSDYNGTLATWIEDRRLTAMKAGQPFIPTLLSLQSNPLGLKRIPWEEKGPNLVIAAPTGSELSSQSFYPSFELGSKIKSKWICVSGALSTNLQEGDEKSELKVQHERINPKMKQLYLPYSQRTVSMVFLDASRVFVLLLLCPTLKKDENYLFDDAKDPFVAASQRLSHVGNINTGRCYRKTYDALIKYIGVDMLLLSVMTMDKTHIDMSGWLQMEPITVRRLPIAMHILGNINHSTPPHLPSLSEL